jgi:hypothetical protein
MKQLLEKTAVDESQKSLSHPIVYDGEDQAYIDVSSFKFF